MAENLKNTLTPYSQRKNPEYLPPTQTLNYNSFLNTCVFQENEVLRAMSEVKINKIQGPEELHHEYERKKNWACQASVHVIQYVANHMRSLVWMETCNCFTKCLLKRWLISIPKLPSYINFTSTVGKLMESVIRTETAEFLESNNIKKVTQQGFRNKSFCRA